MVAKVAASLIRKAKNSGRKTVYFSLNIGHINYMMPSHFRMFVIMRRVSLPLRPMSAIRLLPDLLINQIAAGEQMEEQADAEAHSAPDLKRVAARVSQFTGLLTH